MESVKHQYYKKMSQINRIPFSLKLASKYLISLLLFTALLICSSLLPVMIKTVEFFTLINKNYMFLVCNGLLVFIVKNSGLITNSHQETSPSKMEETHVKYHLKKAPEVAEVKTEKVSETKKPVREMEEKSLVVVKDEEESVLVTEESVESHEENSESVVVVVDEVYEEDEVVELLSAEELHKKCEDFIRKMKEVIRYESQQLILVQ